MIRKRAMVNSIGLMVKCIEGSGKMVDSMAKEKCK